MPQNQTERRRERLLRPEEVADMFGYQPKTVVGWAKRGLLRFIRTPGGQYRFRPADVDDLLAMADDFDELPQTRNGPVSVLHHRDEPFDSTLRAQEEPA